MTLGCTEQHVLAGILGSCSLGCTVGATSSPANFARVLASYLAHCSERGTLVQVAAGEQHQFADFFRVLNSVLAGLWRDKRALQAADLEQLPPLREAEAAASDDEEEESSGYAGPGSALGRLAAIMWRGGRA